MADSTIAALAAVTAATGAEKIPCDAAGADKHITAATILTDDVHGGFSEYPAIANPSAPAANFLRWYARKISGRMMPKFVGPSGVDMVVQPALFGNRICMFSPQNGTTGTGGTTFGPAWTS